MRPVILSRALVAGAAGAICASQTTAGAGNLLINGTLAAGGVATLDVQRNIGITSGGNDAAVVFTVTGTDQQGRVISETITGVSTNTVSSVLNYLTITSIAASAAVANAVTVDTLGTGSSTELVTDKYIAPFSVSINVNVTGTLNYTVQYTFDDVFAKPGGPFNWTAVAALTAQTTTQNSSLSQPVSALRLVTNSGAGTGQIEIIQAGLGL
jgi:hypothetical protein